MAGTRTLRSARFSRRFVNTLKSDWQRLAVHRRKRLELLKRYVGHNFSKKGTRSPRPVNQIEKFLSILTFALAPSNPQVLVSALRATDQARADADSIRIALNQLLGEIVFENTLQTAVFDALVGPLSCIKVGIATGTSARQGSYLGAMHDTGQPFADSVNFNSLVFDTEAEAIDAMNYVGDFYLVPFEQALESEAFNNDALRAAKEHALIHAHPPSSIDDSLDSVKEISSGNRGPNDGEDLFERIRLCDVFFPTLRVVATYASDDQGNLSATPVRVSEWYGPERGPYHFLQLAMLPGQILAPGPAAHWVDLDTTINFIANRVRSQAFRYKKVVTVSGGSEEDEERLEAAHDGQAVSLMSGGVNETVFGGIDKNLVALMGALIQQLDADAGNMSLIGGLAAQSETLGQDQLLASNASKRIQWWQSRIYSFTKRVVRDLGWWLFTDPFIVLPMTKRVQGTDLEFPVEFSPSEMEGDYLDYRLDITPYSLKSSSPSEKLASILSIFQQVLLPMMPALEAQGKTIDATELVDVIASLSGNPEIQRLISSAQPPEQDVAQPPADRPLKAPVSFRHYIRRGGAGPTPSAAENLQQVGQEDGA